MKHSKIKLGAALGLLVQHFKTKLAWLVLVLVSLFGSCETVSYIEGVPEPISTTRNYYLGSDLPFAPEEITLTAALEPFLTVPEPAEEASPPTSTPAPKLGQAGPRLHTGLLLPVRTFAEIKDFLAAHPVHPDVVYRELPIGLPVFRPGQLDDATLQSALHTLNRIRYIAGVPATVRLDTARLPQMQTTALLLAHNHVLTHTPAQPGDFPAEAYELGRSGAGGANLATTLSRDPIGQAIKAFLADDAPENALRVGHRRWILNPKMGTTAFGSVEGYFVLHAIDDSGHATQEHEIIPYPAQVTPIEFFGDDWPWSISFDAVYDLSQARVLVVRRGDGESWKFGAGAAPLQRPAQHNGQPGCLVFQPKNMQCRPGEIYDLQVDGLRRAGAAHLLRYTVQFI